MPDTKPKSYLIFKYVVQVLRFCLQRRTLVITKGKTVKYISDKRGVGCWWDGIILSQLTVTNRPDGTLV